MASSERKAQKSFGLRDSRDMLEKLRWELSSLFCRQPYDVTACKYHAFNCAVTAWHITDWVWHDITPDVKERLGQKIQKSLKRCKDFQNYVCKACPSVNLCRQIANGSKHCLLERNPNPNISAGISDGEGYDYGNPIIVDGHTRHMADRVFHDALFWFERFFQEWNVFPDEPFVPSDDSPAGNRPRLRQVPGK